MRKKRAEELNTIIYLTIAVALFLIFPYLLRMHAMAPTVIGQEPYYNARLAERILENNMDSKDAMVYGGRTIHYTPYHFLLAGVSFIIGMNLALVIVPLVCGIISVILFYLLLRRFKLERFASVVSVLVLASSPAFIYTFSSMQDSLAIALTLLGGSLFFDKRKILVLLSFVCFLGASLFSVFNALIILSSLLVYSFAKKKKQRLSMALVFVLILGYFINTPPVFYKLVPASANILKEAISDIGGLLGIGAFYFILAAIGIIATWEDKKKYYPVYLIALILCIASYFSGSYVMVYLNFYLCVFAALGFIRIRELKWQMKTIKNLTFIIIVCGLLFSMISFSTRLAQMPPDSKMLTGLGWLKANSKSDMIISDPSNGYFIEYLAERPVLLDGYYDSIEDFNRKYIDSYSLFHTLELSEAEEILGRYGIRYIVITKDMKDGAVWERPDEGLLYLFRNNETFKSIYSSKEVEIWKYLGKAE